jgi:hypothetical protein
LIEKFQRDHAQATRPEPDKQRKCYGS